MAEKFGNPVEHPVNQTKLNINNVRLSYAHVWEPKAMTDASGKVVGAPKYSVSILIPKTDKVQLKAIQEKIDLAFAQGMKDKWGGKKPVNPKMPLRDGDTDRPENPEYAGCMFITASSGTKPGIVDRKRQPITDETEVYSGVYGNVNVNFYPFNQAGSKGVACGLNHIQKVKDGEALSGRGRAEDEFEEIADDEENLLG